MLIKYGKFNVFRDHIILKLYIFIVLAISFSKHQHLQISNFNLVIT